MPPKKKQAAKGKARPAKKRAPRRCTSKQRKKRPVGLDRPLNVRQRAFVDRMPESGFDATAAAVAAGYSPRSARSQGSQMMADPRIRAAVEARQAELAERSLVSAERVLEELATVGLADMRDYVEFTPQGDMLLAFDRMPPKSSRAISEITQKKYFVGPEDDQRLVTETKFKLHPKTPALNLIAQHLGMLVNRHQQLDKHGKPTDPPKEFRVRLVRAEISGD